MKPLVIKLGGALLDSKEALNNLFVALTKYKKQFNRPLIIVHGGGYLVDELMAKLSLPVVRRQGLRVTPPEQIDVIVGALSGSANKTLLAEAKKHQLNSIGLCLSDGNTVNVTQLSEDLGCVGDPTAGDAQFLSLLLNNHYFPIISSIGMTDAGILMNVNADHAAVAVAQTLSADLVLLSDVAGVLDANKQLIPELTKMQAEALIAQGVITDGMIVKVNSALEAASMLKHPISIASWKDIDQLINIFNGESVGTKMIV